MKSKVAFITGITGQDGAYLAKYLLSLNYKVYGLYRRTSSENFWRLEYLEIRHNENLVLIEGDLLDLASLIRTIKRLQPDEIYNLAAQSFVGVSFEQPILTANVTAIGALNVLEAVREASPSTKIYQAGTSEMFGLVQAVPQNEETPFYPRSPYAVGKLYAHWAFINYRESYDLFASNGILFNHESPLRGKEFVTRKITDGVARIAHGLKEPIRLGNLDAKRDWGYASDYVKGMHLILQHEIPDTFVLATGETRTVREFITEAFNCVDITLDFDGSDVNEVARNKKTGDIVIQIDPQFYRPAEVDLLLGNPSKAKTQLGWSPEINFKDLVELMVRADVERIQK